ncbi:unnamed protein product [Victoria cruziana]
MQPSTTECLVFETYVIGYMSICKGDRRWPIGVLEDLNKEEGNKDHTGDLIPFIGLSSRYLHLNVKKRGVSLANCLQGA